MIFKFCMCVCSTPQSSGLGLSFSKQVAQALLGSLRLQQRDAETHLVLVLPITRLDSHGEGAALITMPPFTGSMLPLSAVEYTGDEDDSDGDSDGEDVPLIKLQPVGTSTACASGPSNTGINRNIVDSHKELKVTTDSVTTVADHPFGPGLDLPSLGHRDSPTGSDSVDPSSAASGKAGHSSVSVSGAATPSTPDTNTRDPPSQRTTHQFQVPDRRDRAADPSLHPVRQFSKGLRMSSNGSSQVDPPPLPSIHRLVSGASDMTRGSLRLTSPLVRQDRTDVRVLFFEPDPIESTMVETWALTGGPCFHCVCVCVCQ